MSFSYHFDVDFLSGRASCPAGVQQESSRKQNGHSLSEMPVSINRCDCESYDSSRGGTRTPDPVINSHLLYHLSYSGIASKTSQSRRLNQQIDDLAIPRFSASFTRVILAQATPI